MLRPTKVMASPSPVNEGVKLNAEKVDAFMFLSMSVAAPPVFAGHDHGPQGSTNDGASQGHMDDQNAKESEVLINNCVQYIERIQQHVRRLQTQIKGKRVGTSGRDEIKKLEENLKEASDSARSLQIM